MIATDNRDPESPDWDERCCADCGTLLDYDHGDTLCDDCRRADDALLERVHRDEERDARWGELEDDDE